MNKFNKFEVGDKVYILNGAIDAIGTIIGLGYQSVNGKCENVYYHVRFEYKNKIILEASNIPEESLVSADSIDCERDFDEWCTQFYHKNNSHDDDFENELDDDEIEDYKYNKSCESIDNDKKFNLGNLATSLTYPQIRDYYYDEKTATTVVKWTDNTITKVKAAEGDTPDQHTGLANAVAKKYFGNGNLFAREAKWWIVDEPKARKEEEEFCKNYDAEQARLEAKRKANRERRIINAKALARKREYEARKLAAEKYGVPMEWGDDKE